MVPPSLSAQATPGKPTWACRPRRTSSVGPWLSCLVFPHRRPPSRSSLLPPTAACEQGGVQVLRRRCCCNKLAHKRATQWSWWWWWWGGVSSLCHFSNAVHVESRNLLGHHAAHGQLQLQQRRSKTVVLAKKVEQNQCQVGRDDIEKKHIGRYRYLSIKNVKYIF